VRQNRVDEGVGVCFRLPRVDEASAQGEAAADPGPRRDVDTAGVQSPQRQLGAGVGVLLVVAANPEAADRQLRFVQQL
jgi:hypothetical protein